MKIPIRTLAVFLLPGSITSALPPALAPQPYLSEDQVIDMMNHARRWDGRTVTVRIFPYDMGAGEPENGTYVVCFEACERAIAERSIFLVYTRPGRFGGYRGDRPVVVTARFDGRCLYRYDPSLCPDLYMGKLTEVSPPAGR